MPNFLTGLLGAVQDPQFRSDFGRGLLDAGNRGAVAGLLGGPVDMATMLMRPLGYNVEKPVGGSEWIGQKMQDAGFVSPNRNPLAEALASFAVPAAANRLAPLLFNAEQAAAANLAKPAPMNFGMRGQFGGVKIGGEMAKIDEATGLPLNADGTVTVYHHTSKANAEAIAKQRALKSAGEPSVYLTTEKNPVTGYGDTVVPVNVKPSLLQLDDEFPGGRLDFSIDVKKPGGSFRF